MHTPAVPFRSPMSSEDAIPARRLQDEKDGLAEAEEETIRKGAEIAASMTENSDF